MLYMICVSFGILFWKRRSPGVQQLDMFRWPRLENSVMPEVKFNASLAMARAF